MSRSITIKKIDGKPGKVYYPLQLNTQPKPVPGKGEILICLHAAALNHRDFFIRQHLYPGISFSVPLLADGSGTVESIGPDVPPEISSRFLNKLVIPTPNRGWASDPTGPEPHLLRQGAGSALGGAGFNPAGMLQDYVCVPYSEVELCPPHLTPVQAAALPLVGLTGWRALVTKSGNAEAGRNILITGIGGGVALQVLQFAVAMGCNVYVTSGSQEKLDRAKQLGAKGGVNYRSDSASGGWEKSLAAQLPKDRPFLDAIIDGAGGDIVKRATRLLKQGGVISSYGMTVSPKMDWLMSAVMRNIELRGSTMGSRAEFAEMVKFVAEKGIVPVVSRVATSGLDDLAAVDGLFEDMRDGKQFGKLVVEISKPGEKAKL